MGPHWTMCTALGWADLQKVVINSPGLHDSVQDIAVQPWLITDQSNWALHKSTYRTAQYVLLILIPGHRFESLWCPNMVCPLTFGYSNYQALWRVEPSRPRSHVDNRLAGPLGNPVQVLPKPNYLLSYSYLYRSLKKFLYQINHENNAIYVFWKIASGFFIAIAA